ncbi:4Fe-4S binding protein [candidate division WOR-3 bacterium]|nr:4Fe-4S binding protein [candidate division WOR-3 bacterium]
MKNNVSNDGLPCRDSLANSFPDKNALAVSAKAVIECFQEIPCNPCVGACPRGAISIAEGINGIPSIDHTLCNGCSLCVYQCPGLAIFVVGLDRKDPAKGFVSLPYEFLPVPEKDDIVDVLDREGKVISEGKILKVNKSKATDRTSVVTVEVPSNLLDKARFIKTKRGSK